MRLQAGCLTTVLFIAAASAATAAEWFDLADYRKLRETDRDRLEFTLTAMHEAIFYAQESVSRPTVCASPAVVSGKWLTEAIDQEISKPSHPIKRDYEDRDHVAFVLLNALKNAGACR